MSDFLRNLRSSRKKDGSDPKKNLDGHYYPQNERRKAQDRRSNSTEDLESLWTGLGDALPQLVDNSSKVILQLEKVLAVNDLMAAAKIRQYNAVAIFFDHLNKIFTEDFVTQSSGGRSKVTASDASGIHYTKEDIITIIRTMRKKDATFAVIAEYLKEKGIPTFSGRGEWHAQTIHRLCK